MEQVTSEGFRRLGHRAGCLLPRVVAGLALLLLPFALPAADEPLEYEVKAAFLLNFTKFVEWPAASFPAPDAPIEICVMGADPFGNVLDQIVGGEVVNGRRVTAQRIKRGPLPKSCDVLYASAPDKETMKTIQGFGPGVLTVGEGRSFVREGGIIAFVIENRRVRFVINETAAANAGLKLSSKLLNVASSVEK